MRHFHWKTAIVSILVFILPMFFYPVSGTMIDGVTTFSYGFPSKWLSLHFQNQGGRLFGFELFGANIISFNISFLTALLDLLIIYFVLTAFIKVFWTNHFSIKLSDWRTRRTYEKRGLTPPDAEGAGEEVTQVACIAGSHDEEEYDAENGEEENCDEYSTIYEEAFPQDAQEDVEANKTA